MPIRFMPARLALVPALCLLAAFWAPATALAHERPTDMDRPAPPPPPYFPPGSVNDGCSHFGPCL